MILRAVDDVFGTRLLLDSGLSGPPSAGGQSRPPPAAGPRARLVVVSSPVAGSAPGPRTGTASSCVACNTRPKGQKSYDPPLPNPQQKGETDHGLENETANFDAQGPSPDGAVAPPSGGARVLSSGPVGPAATPLPVSDPALRARRATPLRPSRRTCWAWAQGATRLVPCAALELIIRDTSQGATSFSRGGPRAGRLRNNTATTQADRQAGRPLGVANPRPPQPLARLGFRPA
jgi:hypothetical protein